MCVGNGFIHFKECRLQTPPPPKSATEYEGETLKRNLRNGHRQTEREEGERGNERAAVKEVTTDGMRPTVSRGERECYIFACCDWKWFFRRKLKEE